MKASFKSNWPLALIVALMLPVLLSLGLWQLQRADDKRARLAEQAAEAAKPPVTVLALNESIPEFRAIRVEGRFDPERYWLLENRIYQGRYGFELVSPFVLTGGDTILVHRGWLPGDRSRRTLPDVTTPSTTVTLLGRIDRGSASGFSLGAEPSDADWPKRLQWLPIERAEAELNTALPELMLRLEPDEPGMYTQTYEAVNMRPEKHVGYAVQWFGMAAIILALFGYRLWRQQQTSESD